MIARTRTRGDADEIEVGEKSESGEKPHLAVAGDEGDCAGDLPVVDGGMHDGSNALQARRR